MKTGLSALRHVRQTLLASQSFSHIVGNKVYYVAAKQGAVKPYITCVRTAVVSEYAKDGWVKDNAVVAVNIVTDGYEQAVEIAEIVREVLEDSTKDYGDWQVVDCRMTRSAEGYSDEVDAYVITMDFDISIT